MTKSTGKGRGRLAGSKNKPKKDASQKRMDAAFIPKKSTQEEIYSGNSNSTNFSSISESTFSPEKNSTASNGDFLPSRSQEENGAFEPLDYEESDDNQEDDDDLYIDRASIEREEEEFIAIVEGSPVDELTKTILERLGRSANRGEPPSEYTVGRTFWVSSACPSFALQGNQAPKPKDLYTPRMFLRFPQYLTGNGKKLLCSVPKCNGHLNVKGFTPKARRVIDIKE
ncbi:hypothetical protein BD408DRAFT_436014 [Parasitella parasitica]|nr:hypothetical protein BD408DRAFT_436014 [Parasitella parasitica]